VSFFGAARLVFLPNRLVSRAFFTVKLLIDSQDVHWKPLAGLEKTVIFHKNWPRASKLGKTRVDALSPRGFVLPCLGLILQAFRSQTEGNQGNKGEKSKTKPTQGMRI
jgi:hypothetical protein